MHSANQVTIMKVQDLCRHKVASYFTVDMLLQYEDRLLSFNVFKKQDAAAAVWQINSGFLQCKKLFKAGMAWVTFPENLEYSDINRLEDGKYY